MSFANQLAFFCTGVLAFRLAHPRSGSEAAWLIRAGRWLPWLVLVASVLWLVVGWSFPLRPFLDRNHLATHWSAVSWLLILVGATVGLPWLVNNPALRYAGKLSFGLYLMNPMVIFGLVKSGLYPWLYARLPELPAFLASIVLTVLAVAFVAQLAYLLVEQPGIALGERVYRRFAPNAPVPTPANSVSPTTPNIPVRKKIPKHQAFTTCPPNRGGVSEKD